VVGLSLWLGLLELGTIEPIVGFGFGLAFTFLGGSIGFLGLVCGVVRGTYLPTCIHTYILSIDTALIEE